MALFALFQLLLLAGALPQLQEHFIPIGFVHACEIMILVSLPIFWLEATVRLAWLERGRLTRNRVIYCILFCVIPPLRLGLTPASAKHWVWLPGLSWVMPGRPLARRIAKSLSIPMIVIALLILPALALEFVFQKFVAGHTWAQLVLDVTTRVIWLAFAIELVVMVAVSRRKVEHCTRHWVDVLIVLFPLVSFLRVFRLGVLVRTTRLASLARTYRLRAVAFRLLRAILLLRVLDRVSLSFAERRLESLRNQIDKHKRSIHELSEEIEELEADIAARKIQKGQACPTDQGPSS